MQSLSVQAVQRQFQIHGEITAKTLHSLVLLLLAAVVEVLITTVAAGPEKMVVLVAVLAGVIMARQSATEPQVKAMTADTPKATQDHPRVAVVAQMRQVMTLQVVLAVPEVTVFNTRSVARRHTMAAVVVAGVSAQDHQIMHQEGKVAVVPAVTMMQVMYLLPALQTLAEVGAEAGITHSETMAKLVVPASSSFVILQAR